MSGKPDYPPAYGSPGPQQPNPTYQNYPPQGHYQSNQNMGYYPQQGGHPQQQGGFYPPQQQGGYYPPQGYQQHGYPQQGYPPPQDRGSSGCLGALIGAMACCCCLDCLF